ncbi:MAG TPA: DUF2946 family protein [Stellaceae bacterium]|nr:DUF2946 family protein [Stellaceae bacterium]
MLWRGSRLARLAAAMLGGIALACNAAVPVVLAFLLSAALAPAQREWVQLANGEWRFVGELCSHHDDGGANGRHGKTPGAPCPVCSLHGTLAVALPAPVATPSSSVLIATAALPGFAATEPAVLFASVYRSRAPPTL